MVGRSLTAALHKLGVPPDARLGLAVSGGPDSLALLLLAHDAGLTIEAATVDHGLRPEAADEARFVGKVCKSLDVPHSILELKDYGVFSGRSHNVPARGGQAWAREVRYATLARWCGERGLERLVTAHHANDQAETVLMRLARGSGVRGLGGIRPTQKVPGFRFNPDYKTPKDPRMIPSGALLVRPLLDWTKAELCEVVANAALSPVSDPSNADHRFDRTWARELLAQADRLQPKRLAAVASHMRDTEEALIWAEQHAWAQAREITDMVWLLDPKNLPVELLRRIVDGIIYEIWDKKVGGISWDLGYSGPELTRFIEQLQAGKKVTLAEVIGWPKAEGWCFRPAPPRRE